MDKFLLLISLLYAMIDIASTSPEVIRLIKGDTVTMKCHSTTATSLYWTDSNHTTVRDCSHCNVRSLIRKDSSKHSVALLVVATTSDADYSVYKCFGVTSDGVTMLSRVRLVEMEDHDTACIKEYREAERNGKDVPICDEDGMFSEVQVKEIGSYSLSLNKRRGGGSKMSLIVAKKEVAND